MSEPDLKKIGITSGGEIGDAAPSPLELRVGAAKALVELEKDFAFYTPALIHLTIPLTFDPFGAFLQEYNKEVKQFSVRFDEQVFKGLIHPNGDESWNYVLFGMEREHWDSYRKWLGTCAFNEPGRKLLRRIRTQEFVIADPLAAESGVHKDLTITAFVVESNKGSFYFLHTGVMGFMDVVHDIPTATFDKDTYPDTVMFADAINAGESDPYGKIEESSAFGSGWPNGDLQDYKERRAKEAARSEDVPRRSDTQPGGDIPRD